ncbi:MAG: T9SS type A sorting domain-containing protein, partial [Aquaticitalea sp.]
GVYNVTAGNTLALSTSINLSNTMTGLVNGNLNWNSNIVVATTASFNFTGTAGINWVDGSLLGGGTLTNTTKLNMTTTATKYIQEASILKNTGTLNCLSNFTLYIYSGSINNQSSGVIDIQALPNLAPATSDTHTIVNSGLIKKTTDTGAATISVALTNTGTIAVQKGTLNLTSEEKTFNGGVYNVTAGNTLALSTAINLSNTMTGIINGNLNWNSNMIVASTASFNFTGTAGINWVDGSLNGGGTLTNTTKLNLTTTATKYIQTGTTLSNTGTLNCMANFTLYIYSGILNNQSAGVIDIPALPNLAPATSDPHNIINSGLIKKTTDTGAATISVALTNTGTIAVQKGTLNLTNEAKTFNGGIYDVSDASVLNLSTAVVCSGTLTGTLTGPMSWNNSINIPTATTATFNFSGTTGINFADGSLNGGGTLTNAGKMNMNTTATKYIQDGSTLSNTGTINCLDNFTLYIYSGILNNQSSGVIDIQALPVIAPATSDAHSIVNSGLIKKTVNTGVAQINVMFTNSGTIDSQMGNLQINANPFVNTIDGIIMGTATVDLPAISNYTNDGTFAPGGFPGLLTVLGDYKSSTTSVLDLELNGLIPITEYDVLAITGTNVVFDGDVNVTLGFDAAVGNAFTVATTTGTITTKSLTSPFTADYQGFRYTFNITYPNDKAVKLTVSARVDIQAPDIIAQNVTLQLNASGNATLTTAMVNNGTTDNGSTSANISYSLSKMSFNCSNLGDNTVTLTAKDEANNSSTATATVTVVDSINPTVSCGGDTTVNSPGNYTLPNYTTNGVASAADNCSATLVQTPAAGMSLANGVYSISFMASDSSGNTASCSFNLTVNDTSLGVNDVELSESSILLFPNPVRTILTIKNVKQLELVNGQIMDVTGKIINTFDLKEMGLTKEISMENYASGMYFVKINALNGSVTKRIVKE